MQEEEQQIDDMPQQDAPNACDAPPPPPQPEHGEAVDESDPAEASAATDELSQWRERALRTAAEYDNYRKRCVKEREEFTRYATRGLLEELLPILDNFEMGMKMAEQEKGSMIYIGMNMVKKQMQDFLAAQGVETIPCEQGQVFDHNLHEAIMSEPSEQAEGSILRVLRPGYMLKGKLLRPVNVVVAAPAAADEA
ncbi:MAG: nucleotide exchange factor GrpE [Akkermansiaceae bacterium]|nr:nucleotide exchange factor GrpE [Akkermansiaceae bacterium]